MNGNVITIHLIDGTIDGLYTAEIAGWVGQVIVALKPDLPKLLTHTRVKGLGMYVLIGNDPNQPDRKQIYVGQGNVSNRLTQHNGDPSKAFWDDMTVVITDSNGSLHGAHYLYLESRLIDLAKRAWVADLTNTQQPSPPYLPDADRTVAENFLAQVQTLLPVIGIDYFVSPPQVTSVTTQSAQQSPTTTTQPSSAHTSSPVFVLSAKNYSAQAQIVNSKFTILTGSTANPATSGGTGQSYRNLRVQLRQNDKIVDDQQSNNWVFAEDVPFNSTSAAAAVVHGFNIAGPTAWKVKGTQQTYADWLQAQVSAVTVVPAAPVTALAIGTSSSS